MPVAPVRGPLLVQRGLVTMAEQQRQQPEESSGTVRVELMAQSNRQALGSLTRDGEQQYVGVPPPGYQEVSPPSLMQRARTPFLGVTFLATAVVAGWQSNRMYKTRQQGLLDQFAVTMLYHLGDEREMAATIKNFRSQLGPGNFRGQMFLAFVVQLATDATLGVKSIGELKRVVAQMQMTQSQVTELLGEAMESLQKTPSVLGKLVFLAERAVPAAASAAKLRTKFPSWSEETVSTLQRAMLENLYRDLIEEGPGHDAPETLQMLGLSAAEASRLEQEVADKKAEADAAKQAEQAERLRAEQLQDAIRKASEVGKVSTRTTDEPEGGGGDDFVAGGDDAGDGGTHEYECTECGYVMFPAKGREFKFFGDDFKCPTPGCGADKSAFVDNGAVGTLP